MLFRFKNLGRIIHQRNNVISRQRSEAITTVSTRLTVKQVLTQWTERFLQAGVPEPQLSSEYIISHVLGHKTLNSLRGKGLSQMLSQAQLERICKLSHKRLTRMPVQYVIEEWDFKDITLKMKPPVFIPRPETEELVSLVLADLQERGFTSSHVDKLTFLEVGCGSGAISLSLLHSLTQVRGIAVDQSDEAVNLTRENAQRLGLHDRLKTVKVDVMKDSDWLLRTCDPVDVIVSNPPYLFTEDLNSLEPEIQRFEDHAALDGGEEGLCVIEQILVLAPQILTDTGRIYLEMDPRHPQLIQTRLKERMLRLDYVKTHYDFTNREEEPADGPQG